MVVLLLVFFCLLVIEQDSWSAGSAGQCVVDVITEPLAHSIS